LIQVRSGVSVAIRNPLTSATANAATNNQCSMMVP
jgi:hypothetical protein